MPPRDRPQTRKCFLLLNYPPFMHRPLSLSFTQCAISAWLSVWGENEKRREEWTLTEHIPHRPLQGYLLDQPVRHITRSLCNHNTSEERSVKEAEGKRRPPTQKQTNKNKNPNQTKYKQNKKIANLPRIKIKTYVKSPSVLQTFFHGRKVFFKIQIIECRTSQYKQIYHTHTQTSGLTQDSFRKRQWQSKALKNKARLIFLPDISISRGEELRDRCALDNSPHRHVAATYQFTGLDKRGLAFHIREADEHLSVESDCRRECSPLISSLSRPMWPFPCHPIIETKSCKPPVGKEA